MTQRKVIARGATNQVLDELDATDIPDLSATYDVAGAAAAAQSASVPTSRTVTAGTGLTGGGDLSANRTLAPDFGTGAGKVTQGNDSRLTDSRAPNGAAGGDLSGTYPNPSVQDDSHSHTAATLPAGSGAPTTVDYLVGTADAGLSAEIVVGTSPGGELGGTWASPTVDATHSGSSHAGLSGQPGSTDVAVADGGTGASTAAAARTNLGLPDIPWSLVTKAADESVNSTNTGTTLQDDDHLLFATTAGGLYEFVCYLIYASPVGAATPDIKVTSGEDTTTRGMMFSAGFATNDAAATLGGTVRKGTLAVTGGTAAAKRMMRLYGTFLAVGGTFVMQWAQNTSDANDVTVYAGSILQYRRIT